MRFRALEAAIAVVGPALLFGLCYLAWEDDWSKGYFEKKLVYELGVRMIENVYIVNATNTTNAVFILVVGCISIYSLIYMNNRTDRLAESKVRMARACTRGASHVIALMKLLPQDKHTQVNYCTRSYLNTDPPSHSPTGRPAIRSPL